LAEKSVAWEHAQALSAGNLREQTSFDFANRSSEQQELLWVFAQLELIFVVENAD